MDRKKFDFIATCSTDLDGTPRISSRKQEVKRPRVASDYFRCAGSYLHFTSRMLSHDQFKRKLVVSLLEYSDASAKESPPTRSTRSVTEVAAKVAGGHVLAKYKGSRKQRRCYYCYHGYHDRRPTQGSWYLTNFLQLQTHFLVGRKILSRKLLNYVFIDLGMYYVYAQNMYLCR